MVMGANVQSAQILNFTLSSDNRAFIDNAASIDSCKADGPTCSPGEGGSGYIIKSYWWCSTYITSQQQCQEAATIMGKTLKAVLNLGPLGVQRMGYTATTFTTPSDTYDQLSVGMCSNDQRTRVCALRSMHHVQ